MENIELPTVQCPKCGHRWIPRTPNPQLCPHCNKRLQRGDAEYRHPILSRESRSAHGLGFGDNKTSVIASSDLANATLEQLQQYQRNAQIEKEQREEDQDAQNDHYVMGQIYGAVGSFTNSNPTLEQQIKEAVDFNAPRLRQAIEAVEIQIKRRQEAKVIIADVFTREKLEKAMWNRKSITIVSKEFGPLRAFGVTDMAKVEELLARAEEMQDLMDCRIEHLTKLKEAYASQLLKLNETTPSLLKEKLREIQEIVKEAKD
jgi:hypothetical protein